MVDPNKFEDVEQEVDLTHVISQHLVVCPITGEQLHRESIESQALALVSASEAWQYMLLPIRKEEGCWVIACSLGRLPEASQWIMSIVSEPVHWLVCDLQPLEQCIAYHYDYEGLSAA